MFAMLARAQKWHRAAIIAQKQQHITGMKDRYKNFQNSLRYNIIRLNILFHKCDVRLCYFILLCSLQLHVGLRSLLMNSHVKVSCRALQFAERGSGHIWDRTFSFPLGLQSM